MRLSEEDVTLFYKLYPALLVYVNAEQGILGQISTTDELMSQPVDERVRVRDQLYENIALIDSFANDNPSQKEEFVYFFRLKSKRKR